MALWQRVRGPARTGLLVLAACLAALVAFDVLAYFFLPASLTTFAPGYRRLPLAPQDMRGYYGADPVLGHDIAPNQPGRHLLNIPGLGKIPVASSGLGCRDPRSLADIQQLHDYVYFAGDSFTWGWAREAHSFPRAYERTSGNPSLNCGVEATGQWHQLEKFHRAVRAIGRQPRLVVIGLSGNDMVDDLWHPSFAVVRGMKVLVYRRIHRPEGKGLALAGKGPAAQGDPSWFWRDADAERTVTAWERRLEGLQHPLRGFHPQLRALLWRHSLLYNIRHRMHILLEQVLEGNGGPPEEPQDRQNMAGITPQYLQSPYTRSHREALRAWARHARKHGYQLAVVLIPNRRFLGTRRSRGWRAGVRTHLAALGVPLLDFAEHALAQGLRIQDLYWLHNVHLSEDGNRILGEWLARELPQAAPIP